MSRPAQARLDLGALRHNFALARRLTEPARVMAVVKANGYGHGAVTIAAALDAEADAFAVASCEEALGLRNAGITRPILLLEGAFQANEIPLAAEFDLWLTIDNEWQLELLEQAEVRQPVKVWLKVDTGMHRLGIEPVQARSFYNRIRESGNAHPDIVLTTHFATADELDNPNTERQIQLFTETCEGLPCKRSAANSPAVLAWPESHMDWVRPGYMLYGDSPFAGRHPEGDRLQPVMTLASQVISLRDVAPGESVGYGATWTARRPSRIATIAIGYGDGYPRTAENGTPVLIHGQRAPLAGRVSMDMITVDVTDIPAVERGDEVILWGRGLPLRDVACHCHTIGYELLARMPLRAPRVITG